MNGRTENRFVLDSCTCIDILEEGMPLLPPSSLFVSVITRMEVLAKPSHTVETERKAQDFMDTVTVIPLSPAVECEAVHIRRDGSPRLKLPDAIIAATAVVLDAQLLTTDEKLLHLVWPGLNATPASP